MKATGHDQSAREEIEMKSMSLALCATILVAGSLAIGCGGGTASPASGGPSGPSANLFEDFLDTARRDAAATDADWGVTEQSILRGQPVTSRTVHVYGYAETDNLVNSGRGQYVATPAPLIGTSYNQVNPNPIPPTAQGRRVMQTFSDAVLGAAGLITSVAWGPDRNVTAAATYPNVKLRMGLQVSDSLSLLASFGSNYQGPPTVVYDGPYTVQANANVGNTPGHPATPHVDGYAQGAGCAGVTGTWNRPLFDHTGWYAWPTPTTLFSWDPGDPQVDGDSVLLFDASVQEGDVHQLVRAWFAVTYPCSGILIGGHPETRLDGTYEGIAANPPDNFAAGIVNPGPGIADTRFTITNDKSVAQSRFMTAPYGDDTDYQTPILVPAAQAGSAVLQVEFQGADAVETDRVTIDPAEPFTDWVQDVNACDGMRNIRFRITLISDLATLAPARLDSITIPTVDSNP